MLAIEVQNLKKSFPVGEEMIPILHDISVQVRIGELTMLVGPSGCGKTTLISIMSGILSPTSGNVVVFGHLLHQMSDREKVILRRREIGFIFQQYNLLPALTAAENAAIPLFADGVPEHEAVLKAEAILNQIGMQGHTGKLPSQLSGGQQQRVAIARALVHEPRLIVCDEPTAALDAKTGQSVMHILRDVANDKSRAVLIVTHDHRIYHFADRILEMSDGRLMGDYTPETFVQKE